MHLRKSVARRDYLIFHRTEGNNVKTTSVCDNFHNRPKSKDQTKPENQQPTQLATGDNTAIATQTLAIATCVCSILAPTIYVFSLQTAIYLSQENALFSKKNTRQISASAFLHVHNGSSYNHDGNCYRNSSNRQPWKRLDRKRCLIGDLYGEAPCLRLAHAAG